MIADGEPGRAKKRPQSNWSQEEKLNGPVGVYAFAGIYADVSAVGMKAAEGSLTADAGASAAGNAWERNNITTSGLFLAQVPWERHLTCRFKATWENCCDSILRERIFLNHSLSIFIVQSPCHPPAPCSKRRRPAIRAHSTRSHCGNGAKWTGARVRHGEELPSRAPDPTRESNKALARRRRNEYPNHVC